MGSRSIGYGEIVIRPAFALPLDSEFHPASLRSERLVQVVLDASGRAEKLVPHNIDGSAKYLDEPYLDDIDEFVRNCPVRLELDGFLGYYEDDGDGNHWRATPVRSESGQWRTYVTRPLTEWPPHEWPEDPRRDGEEVRIAQ